MTTLCLVKFSKVYIFYTYFLFVQTNQMELFLSPSHFHRTSLRSLTKSFEVWFYVQWFILLEWKPFDDKNHELFILNHNCLAQCLA